MADYITNYAKKKQYYFHFYSVVSGEQASFPALLTQLDDKFSPNWNPQRVFGRQDPILTFQGTERKIDVAFDVPSNSIQQAKENLVTLNRLINFLYPGFSRSGTANTISASPLFRIKFANLIYDQSKGAHGNDPESGLVCGIDSFSHSFKFDGSAGWVDEVGSAIPAFFSVNFSATILHTHDLGYIANEYRPESEFPYFVREAGPSAPAPGLGKEGDTMPAAPAVDPTAPMASSVTIPVRTASRTATAIQLAQSDVRWAIDTVDTNAITDSADESPWGDRR